jgi:membrane-bound metal-dependent hydrolase YbcI (DUF457 family)
MDIFTHILSGYLVSYWSSLFFAGGFSSELYVVLGTFMAVIPDMDMFLKPFWGRRPNTSHHGITHMFSFIIIISTIIYISLAVLLGIQDPGLLLLMYLTGSMHLLWDFVGTGGVRPFYPFQKRYLKLNLEVGANPLLGIYSLLSMLFLLAIHLGLIDFMDFHKATLIIGAGYPLDLGARAALRYYFSRRPENREFTALPTLAPFRWRFARRVETDGEIETILKTNQGPRSYKIPKASIGEEPGNPDLTSTYWLHQVRERLQIFNYPYYRIDCTGGQMRIIWNAAEMGRVMDVSVTCEGGQFAVNTEFHRSFKNYWDDLAG